MKLTRSIEDELAGFGHDVDNIYYTIDGLRVYYDRLGELESWETEEAIEETIRAGAAKLVRAYEDFHLSPTDDGRYVRHISTVISWQRKKNNMREVEGLIGRQKIKWM